MHLIAASFEIGDLGSVRVGEYHLWQRRAEWIRELDACFTLHADNPRIITLIGTIFNKPVTFRFDVVNSLDHIFFLHNGSGIGVFGPQ